MENIVERLLNPGVVLTMVGAGIAYGWFLWSLNIRPTARLWFTAIVPGVVFFGVVATVRAMQGTASLTYVALIIDWLIFASAGAATVMGWRRCQGCRR